MPCPAPWGPPAAEKPGLFGLTGTLAIGFVGFAAASASLVPALLQPAITTIAATKSNPNFTDLPSKGIELGP